jgi:hypothetical protein
VEESLRGASGYIQDVWYACGGRSQEQAMFRKYCMPMVINTRFGMQAKAGAESLPTGREGIGDVQDERYSDSYSQDVMYAGVSRSGHRRFTGCDVDRH